jgi:LacI family transcriptional regulator
VDRVPLPPVAHRAEAVHTGLESLLSLDNPPTALFVSNARHATAVVSHLHDIGRSDVAMVSFGNIDLVGGLAPSITCIDQHPRAIDQPADAKADLV